MGGETMTNLSNLIDQLPPPQIPDHLSKMDRELILLALASAKQQMRPYDGNFEATWLLTTFAAQVWETTNRGREELVNGQWQNTIRIDWRVPLPNGALLTDAKYESLLTLVKRISYLMRCGLVSGSYTPLGWRNATSKLLAVFRWVVLYEEIFMPEQYGLRLIDQPALDWLFSTFAEGGWFQPLQIPQRILSVIYQGAHGVVCPQALLDSPYNVPSEEIEPLVQWLKRQDCYKSARQGVHTGKLHIKRSMLAKKINENPLCFKGTNIGRFFRQFEPEFKDEILLVRLQQYTEFPSQKTESFDDDSVNVCSEESVSILTRTFRTILDSHRHIPNLLPEPASISLTHAISIASRNARPKSHTPFMPINIGLAYLYTAIRYVHLYGEAIIGLYLTVLDEYHSKIGNSGFNKSLKRNLSDWKVSTGEPIAAILNITEFRRKEAKRDFNRFRSNPTLDEALRVLIGSCIVCMALLKPSRDDELTHLKRNCLLEESGGYSIYYKLGKSNSGEAWQDEKRPIPVISARAISLLQRLGSGLSILLSDKRKVSENLFYLPTTQGLGTMSAHGDLLNLHLDYFCDYVGLKPDAEGRRWYVRIHEMRKWFLLLLFWSGRFDVLDAARWIAGHTDVKHIYAYIEREFPGEELPRLEAEYSIDRVYRHEQEKKRNKLAEDNEDDVDALYKAILKHFKVESLGMVPESEWKEYIISLRTNEHFKLEPHSIFGRNGRDIVGINISFVMREVN